MSGFDMSRLPFLMLSAAELIEKNAAAMKEGLTLSDGTWADVGVDDPHDRETYEGEIQIAVDLKLAANELAGINPDKEKQANVIAKRCGFLKESVNG